MKRIQKIAELKKILPYLETRQLVSQYRKAKQYILEGKTLQAKFRERNPKGSGIFYFRINRQFRALGKINEAGILIIFKIDNHQ